MENVFDWQTNNCYHLANQKRLKLGLSKLPYVDYKFADNEYDLPKTFIKDHLEFYCRNLSTPQNGCLVLMNFRNVECLGVWIDKNIHYMNGVEATVSSQEKLSSFISDFYWLIEDDGKIEHLL